ncbi:MAG: hypothetical protein J1E56_07555, partial [Ruminococcus sp.]|nr:hypothetical protein [Ruminococcus sp.]
IAHDAASQATPDARGFFNLLKKYLFGVFGPAVILSVLTGKNNAAKNFGKEKPSEILDFRGLRCE